MNNVLIGGRRPDGRGCTTRPSPAGRAAAPVAPGMSGVHTAMTNTKNTPIEALERAYPMRVLRYRLRRGSGGAGAGAGRRGHRARPPGAGGRDGVADHRAAGVASRGGSPAASPGRWGRTGCCPAATRRGPSALPDKCTIQPEGRRRGADAHARRRRPLPKMTVLGLALPSPGGRAGPRTNGYWQFSDLFMILRCMHWEERLRLLADDRAGLVANVPSSSRGRRELFASGIGPDATDAGTN